jgi:hypothetical protein
MQFSVWSQMGPEQSDASGICLWWEWKGCSATMNDFEFHYFANAICMGSWRGDGS